MDDYDFSYIDFDKKYNIKGDKNKEYTLLEKCLFEKKYKYIRNLCYSKFKDKYTTDEFY